MDKWDLPYRNNRTTKRFTFNKSGIYFIRCIKTKNILYIGLSLSNAYKALYRHFESWNDYKHQRITYDDRNKVEIRVILCDKYVADRYEKLLIRKFQPSDNLERYEWWREEQHSLESKVEQECTF